MLFRLLFCFYFMFCLCFICFDSFVGGVVPRFVCGDADLLLSLLVCCYWLFY